MAGLAPCVKLVKCQPFNAVHRDDVTINRPQEDTLGGDVPIVGNKDSVLSRWDALVASKQAQNDVDAGWTQSSVGAGRCRASHVEDCAHRSVIEA